MAALLANVFRGNIVESQHHGHLVAVDGAGEIVLAHGDPRFVTFMRSAAKPFQAMPLFEDEVPEIFQLSEPEVAVIMASHNGEDRHVQAAAGILQKIGCLTSHLQCGIHVPLSAKVAEKLIAAGEKPGVVHNNCSGKHAGMLAACVNRGLPLENYLDVAHRHQRRILQTMSHWSRILPEQIGIGVDGCSAPNFALPLFNMALMYAALISSHEEACRRIVLTFIKHPEMIAGEGRFDTEIMVATRGRIIAKTGAEGIQCLAIDGPRPMGMALKILDGASRAVPAIVLAALEKLQLISEEELQALSHYRTIERTNHRGINVGVIEAVIW